ncbi:arsenate reductase/protein-tyrosine-phosphatase family protein [Aeoliella sp. SH292]|uniref:arsenate reductase/protein-tyrosine-phosphatase family protein n=1 Tax=Aeoliella sp. SH292 TaxID=3454464 RepID=UPI003F9878FA
MYQIALAMVVGLICTTAFGAGMPQFETAMEPSIQAMAAAVDDLPKERRELLDQAAGYLSQQLYRGKSANVVFICTSNSRRSQLAQAWAQVAAEYYGLGRVHTFSGGTEATACNARTIAALQRAGMEVIETSPGDNPGYRVRYAANREPIELYSKVFTDAANPQREFAAMMCCSNADEVCPVLEGAGVRVALDYNDPKQSDDTPDEQATYDARSREIGGEMFYLFAKVARNLGAK